jgi:hypothetical protein
MDHQQFDRIARLLGADISRRDGIKAALVAFGGAIPATGAEAGPKRKHDGGKGAKTEGPCGDGGRKDNICARDSQCCTGVCDLSKGKTNRDRKGRCRCIRRGNACSEDRNCCRGACRDNICGSSGPTPPPPPPPACASTCANTGCCDGETCVSTASMTNSVCGTGTDGATCVACGAAPNGCCGGVCGTLQLTHTQNVGESDFQEFVYYPTISDDGLTIAAGDTDSSSFSRMLIFSRPDRNSSFSYQTTFGTQGNADDQLGEPYSCTFSSDNLTLYIGDRGNSRISIWRRSNATAGDWSHVANIANLSNVMDMALSADQTTMVAVPAGGTTVWALSRANTSTDAWTLDATITGSTLTRTQGIDISQDGLTIFVDNWNGPSEYIDVWARTSATGTDWTQQYTFGAANSSPDGFGSSNGDAVTGDDLTMFVGQSGKGWVSRWTRPDASSITWTWQENFGDGTGTGPTQFSYIYGVDVTPDGLSLVVGDQVYPQSAGPQRVSVWEYRCPV